jgi:hypothetical protein
MISLSDPLFAGILEMQPVVGLGHLDHAEIENLSVSAISIMPKSRMCLIDS